MSSPTAIANLALGHVAASKEIANLTTDSSAEAEACRRYYAPSRDEFLRDNAYPFTTEIATLGLVETNPNLEWHYSYRYPSACLYFRKIQSGVRNDTRQTRIPHRIAKDSYGKLIFTDRVNAIGEYSTIVTNIALWPPDAQMAFSFLLASYIAPRLTSGDPFKLGERALQIYNFSRLKAQATAFNEQQDEELPDSEFIIGRN